MDEDLLKLEAELKRLRPAQLSVEMQQQIARELRPRRLPLIARWAWLALPMAATTVAIIVLTARLLPVAKSSVSAQSIPAAFKPVGAENVLLSSWDEGYVTLLDGTPARRVRQTYVDTITWKNAKTNASLTWSLPREEVRVVPLILQ